MIFSFREKDLFNMIMANLQKTEVPGVARGLKKKFDF